MAATVTTWRQQRFSLAMKATVYTTLQAIVKSGETLTRDQLKARIREAHPDGGQLPRSDTVPPRSLADAEFPLHLIPGHQPRSTQSTQTLQSLEARVSRIERDLGISQ